jgi:hypothetical protein
LARRWRASGLDQGPSDLQGEQGIATGRLVKAEQSGPRKGGSEPRPDHVVHGRDGKGLDMEALKAFAETGAVQSERDRPAPNLGPNGSKESDRLRRETPEAELEYARGGLVQPLHVIDRDDKRTGRSRRLEGRQGGERYGPLVGPLTIRVRPEQSNFEGAALRRRYLADDVAEYASEQVVERLIRELRFRADRTGNQEAQGTAPGRLDGFRPERRLADPGFALEQQDAQSLGDGIQEALDPGLLVVSPNDLWRPVGEHQ